MKNPKSIASLLGITQEDLSLLFGGHRSRFSRYGNGLGRLTLNVLRIIADIIRYLHDPETDSNAKVVAEQRVAKRHAIEELLADNVAAIARTKLQLPVVKAKNSYCLNGMKSLEFLSTSDFAADEDNAAILQAVAYKTAQGLKSFGSDALFRLEHRLELLELQKLLLEGELRKILRSLENKE